MGLYFLSVWSKISAFHAALPDRIERRGKIDKKSRASGIILITLALVGKTIMIYKNECLYIIRRNEHFVVPFR